MTTSCRLPACVLLVALAALVLAGCAGQPAGAGAQPRPSITPLPASAPTPSPVPTSTAAPTRVAIRALPEVVEGLRLLEGGNCDAALLLLNRAYAGHRDDVEMQTILGETYLGCGRAVRQENLADVQLAMRARARFVDGLAVVAPDAGLAAELQLELTAAERCAGGQETLQALEALTADNAGSAEDREAAVRVVDSLGALAGQRPEDPCLGGLYGRALVAAARPFELSGGAPAERTPLLEQGLGYCRQAAALGAEGGEACVERLGRLITGLRATPTAVPQPQQLRVSKKGANDLDTPGCISMQISGVSAQGWQLRPDGLGVAPGVFDGNGNARVCGLSGEFTFTIFDGRGSPVPGGRGIRARDRDIFIGVWR